LKQFGGVFRHSVVEKTISERRHEFRIGWRMAQHVGDGGFGILQVIERNIVAAITGSNFTLRFAGGIVFTIVSDFAYSPFF